jgi:hypothetical protein
MHQSGRLACLQGQAYMWKSLEHSDDENLRWTWLRAIEWRHWPLFVSQPIVPILLYFYPWPWVLISLAVITFVWWFVIAPSFTPTAAVDLAVYFVWLRFATSPVAAYSLWQSGDIGVAALALFWPLAGNWIVLWLLTIPQAVLSSTARAKSAQIGVVQERLMSRLGYSRIRGVGYIRGRTDGALTG